MEYLTKPTLWAFLIQELIFTSLIVGSYLAYRWVRIPMKQKLTKQALQNMKIKITPDLEERMINEDRLRHYVWPLFLACAVIFVIYAMTHPYIIQYGLWAGFLPEAYDLGVDDLYPRAILVGRILFWAFLGAWVYSVQFIFHRFLAYDLSPSVYLFITSRFLLAFTVGGTVALGLAVTGVETGGSINLGLGMVSVVLFFIGFFPEQGMNWIRTTALRILKQQDSIHRSTQLSEIQGLGIWHQGRLRQEGIENVQNLATTDVLSFIIGTPFPISQIIDWIDQAILILRIKNTKLAELEKVGIFRASEFLTNTSTKEYLMQLAEATNLKQTQLMVLSRGIQSAPNMQLVTHFRKNSSLYISKEKDQKVTRR